MNAGKLNAIVLIAAVVALSCAPASSSTPGTGETARPTGPTRISAATLGDRGIFNTIANLGGAQLPGGATLYRSVNAGMTQDRPDGVRIAMLGTGVPSTTDGSWKVSPDGRMEMSFTLKPNVFWHDGTAMTSADLDFQVKITQDPNSGFKGGVASNYVDGSRIVDDRTVIVDWKSPYIDADQYFSQVMFPKHILQAPYESGAPMPELSHWRRDFIGSGPYKLREYEPDSHAILEAFDQYVLGRPKIDIFEIKFITDTNTVLANVLSGQLDLVLGVFDPAQVSDVVKQWTPGKMLTDAGQNVGLYPQHMGPNPAIIGNPQFRAALLMAIDRQAMVDELQAGYGSVSHTNFFAPGNWQYPYIGKNIVKYPYDQRKAAEAIEGLGYTKGPDGFFRDASGQPLAQVESRTVARQEKTNIIIAEMWKAIGVNATAYTIPQQLTTDREFRSTFPGYQLLQSGDTPSSFRSVDVALPSNNFVGNNRGRFADPTFDDLINRYYATVPIDERMQIMGEMVHWVTDQNISTPTFLRSQAYLIANRVNGANITTWNIETWTVES